MRDALKYAHIFSVPLFALLLLVACAAPETTPEPVAPEPVPEPVVAPPEPVPEPEPAAPQLTLEKEVSDLIAKASKAKNYQFSYAKLPENKANRKYFIKDNKIAVELYTTSIIPAGSFDTVFLDPVKKKAVAYCIAGSNTVCPDKTKIIARPDYAEYAIEFPHQFMAQLDNGEVTGGLTYDSHSAAIVSAVIDGTYAKLTVNRFYGIPMKVEYFATEERTGEPTGMQLRDFGFNTVTDAMVTPPSGW